MDSKLPNPFAKKSKLGIPLMVPDLLAGSIPMMSSFFLLELFQCVQDNSVLHEFTDDAVPFLKIDFPVIENMAFLFAEIIVFVRSIFNS